MTGIEGGHLSRLPMPCFTGMGRRFFIRGGMPPSVSGADAPVISAMPWERALGSAGGKSLFFYNQVLFYNISDCINIPYYELCI